jgi:hypothetical protein
MPMTPLRVMTLLRSDDRAGRDDSSHLSLSEATSFVIAV